MNLRYLGLVAQNTKLAYIRDICAVEMVARACKKILRYNFVEQIKNLIEKLDELDKEDANSEFNNSFEQIRNRMIVLLDQHS